MLYLLIALALVLILLFSKVKVFCEYKKHPGEKLSSTISVYLGAVRILKLKPQKHKKPKQQKEPSDETLVQKLKKYTQIIKRCKRVYAQNRFRIHSTLIVENIDFHIKFGLGNAAVTGIATGALWSLLYGTTALVSQVGTLKKHFFEVVPVYTEKGLILQGSVRLSVRIINAFILAVKLYMTYKKVSEEINSK